MASDSDDFDDDDELDQLFLNRTVNREVKETVTRHAIPLQRTLTGERADPNAQTHYEEIQRQVTYHPTHHEMNNELLSTYIYPSNLQMRDYQFDIIKKALFKNLLCAIPTGMGKTFIASTVMLNYYRWFPKGKIIFMAPTRPLVAQQIQACLGCTDISSSDTAILLDKTRRNRPEIWNSKRVFFTTPQVVENDLKAGTLNPKEIVCVVVDEAHRATGNYAYTNVVKFIDRFNTSFRVLALTATPAADIAGVQAVVNNLDISTIEIRTEESMDIVKYMKKKETVRINVGINSEMNDIIEMLSIAIDPILKQANEYNIYDITDPARINFFTAHQKSVSIVRNSELNEGLKWKYYFILQLIGKVGQMIRRLKIYSIRTFYTYFQQQFKMFKSKYELGKSTDRIAASFYYHDSLKEIQESCENLLNDPLYITHPKLERMELELTDFFEEKSNSRVIIFTELRESALEIVQFISRRIGDQCKPHIFIGQSKGKEAFDEEDYKLKNSKKGRGKANKAARLEKEQALQEERERKKKEEASKRATSRTGTSEEAQSQGMNQKTQKEVIKKFKGGEFNILVATSIGEEGLDIGEVDLIICYDSTSSPIKNIQRMGRTGRKNDGKIILLLAASEEKKFDQSMEDYAKVQQQIASNDLELQLSDRIIPAKINPTCSKMLIEIPEENLVIARGQDEDEIIKYATQAMLGKTPKSSRKRTAPGSSNSGSSKKTKTTGITDALASAPKKRFFMPDNVQTGFVSSSKLVRKVDDYGNAIEKNNLEDANNSVSMDLSSDDSDIEITKESEAKTANTTSKSNYSISKNNGNSSMRSNHSNSKTLYNSRATENSTVDFLEGLFDESDHSDDSDHNHIVKPSSKTSTYLEASQTAQLTKEELEELAELDNVDPPGTIPSTHATPKVKYVIPDSDDEADDVVPDGKLTKDELKELDSLNVLHIIGQPQTKILDFDEAFEDDFTEEDKYSDIQIKEKQEPQLLKRENSHMVMDIDFDSLSDFSEVDEELPNKNSNPRAHHNATMDQVDVPKICNEEDEGEASVAGSEEDEDHQNDFFKEVMATLTTMKKEENNQSKSQSDPTPYEPKLGKSTLQPSLSTKVLNFDAFERDVSDEEDILIDNENKNPPTAHSYFIDFSAYEDKEDQTTADSQLQRALYANEKEYLDDASLDLAEEPAQSRTNKPLITTSSETKDKTNQDPNKSQPQVDKIAKKKKSTKTMKEYQHLVKVDITSLLKERSKPKQQSLRVHRTDLSTVPESQIINLDEDPEFQTQKTLKNQTAALEEEENLIKEPFKYMSQQDQTFPITFLEEEGFLTEAERNQFFSEYYTSAQPSPILQNPSANIKNTRDYMHRVKHGDLTKRFIHFTDMIRSKEGIRLNRLARKLEEKAKEPYDDGLKEDDIIVDDDQIAENQNNRTTQIKELIEKVSQTLGTVPQTQADYNYDVDDDLIDCDSEDDEDYRFL